MYITHDEELNASRVRALRPGKTVGPAVIILGGGPRLQIDNVAEADALIAAACEAKRMLGCAQADSRTVTGCFQQHPDHGVICTLHRDGFHVAETDPDGVLHDDDVQWPIDPAAHVKAAPIPAPCRADQPEPNPGYRCTLDREHEGDHEAYAPAGSVPLATWAADPLPPNKVPAGVDTIGARF